MNKLTDECYQVLVEMGFDHRWTEIEKWHTIGRLICSDKNFKLSDIQKLANRIEQDPEEINQAIMLYKKWPDLSMMPGGKNVSWWGIKENL